ncbi:MULTISPECIES: hypothetical protein [Hymenobacter]|nr:MULTISPECIES: hypothetical protein [Hymenobacter]
MAFNQHDLAQLQTLYIENLEFYHEKGGLANIEQLMQGFRNLFN